MEDRKPVRVRMAGLPGVYVFPAETSSDEIAAQMRQYLEEGPPNTSEELDPLDIVARGGSVAGLFVPGMGIADYTGVYPDGQGGTLPSARENWEQGNYLDSVLQSLGAAGDALTVFGPAGIAVGSVLKAGRASRIANRAVRDSLNLYSAVEETVAGASRGRGTGAEWLAEIRAGEGVRPDEINWRNLEEVLTTEQATWTREQVLDRLDMERVVIEETRLVNRDNVPEPEEVVGAGNLQGMYETSLNNIRTLQLESDVILANPSRTTDDYESFLSKVTTELEGLLDLSRQLAEQDGSGGAVLYSAREAEVLIQEALANLRTAPTFNAVIREVNRYRNNLNQIREQLGAMRTAVWNASVTDSVQYPGMTIVGGYWDQYRDIPGVGTIEPIPDEARTVEAALPSSSYREFVLSVPDLHGQSYTRGHFDAPAPENQVVHFRTLDYIDPETNTKTLYIQEIQSDLHQQARGEGYRPTEPLTELPEHLNVRRHRQSGTWQVVDEDGYAIDEPGFGEMDAFASREDAIEDALRIINEGRDRQPPPAPFRKTYHELALRRAIEVAAREGYDRVAVASGEAQNLIQQWGYAVGADNRTLNGARQFYDRTVPEFLTKYARRLGTTSGRDGIHPSVFEDLVGSQAEFTYIDLPPEVREQVIERGQPMFSIGAGGVGLSTGAAALKDEEDATR